MTIRTLGDHDAATIQQLENCVAAEEGASGVLCADGHLGYSMPIGGVVAYRDHVSPSGVGFDIACIAAGTPVTSEDGYALPIERVAARMECSVRDCGFWVPRKELTPGTRCPRHPDAELVKRRGRIRPGAIDFPTVQAELAAKGIELRGGAADEAPGAYKRLDEVLAHHAGTVRVLHRLIPIGVAMAPAETFDPYKD